ncbi:nuclear transport factor 2 family protein [Duganella sp. CT11-25]|uniref:nuclear transport factor 2 family protein n=1 Tax=unclassified Duganella TaxID=2636909 RepID=UPI0039B120EE
MHSDQAPGSAVTVAEAYLQAVYRGDTAALAGLFDVHAQVYGDIDGRPYHKPIADYIAGVGARQSPQALGEPYRMRVLALDLQDGIAMAKLRSPMLGFNYMLYLTLRRNGEGWLIVNKTFVHRSVE